MKNILWILVLVSFHAYAEEKIDPKKLKNIEELMKVTDAEEMGRAAFKQMLDSYRTTYPDVENKVWEGMEKEANFRELVQGMIPVYDKHFSNEEIETIVQFYKSPVGRKFIQKMPAVQAEAFNVGQMWARKLSDRVLTKIEQSRSEHPKSGSKSESKRPTKEKF